MSQLTQMSSLPALDQESNLRRYLAEIRKFPMLEADHEYQLASAWQKEGDRDAAQTLVTSHLRLVARIAQGYRGYGLPMADLISEGNVGMMQAVRKFDPERGFRLATYAMWWIKASIQEYILRSWSLVKIGTTAAQKKLFFNLRRTKARMHAFDSGDLSPEQVQQIATQLDVPEEDVVQMNRRMGAGGEQSLNAPIKNEEGEGEWQDWLTDEEQRSQEATLIEDDEKQKRLALMYSAMEKLNERERNILIQRRLQDEPKTLEELSHDYGVSRERIRQIEAAAFTKLSKTMAEAARDQNIVSGE